IPMGPSTTAPSCSARQCHSRTVTGAPNGFEALKDFDDNHDGAIDKNDAIWRELLLWRDLNHNGIAEPSEIATIVDSGLTRIELNYHWTGRHDSYGNLFKYEALISLNDAHGASRAKPVYDIFFVTA